MRRGKGSERHGRVPTRFFSLPFSFKRERKAGSFFFFLPAERDFKGDIKGNSSEEGEEEEGGSSRSSCTNLPSIRHFSLSLSLRQQQLGAAVKIQTGAQKALVIIHIQSTCSQSRSGSTRFVGVKRERGRENALERRRRRRKKKRALSSLLPFSPPHGFRLPCRTVGLSCRRLQHRLSQPTGCWSSSALQSQEPTAGSRQLHRDEECSSTPRKSRGGGEKECRRFPDTFSAFFLSIKRLLVFFHYRLSLLFFFFPRRVC